MSPPSVKKRRTACHRPSRSPRPLPTRAPARAATRPPRARPAPTAARAARAAPATRPPIRAPARRSTARSTRAEAALRGLAGSGLHRLHLELQVDAIADEHTAGLEQLVPREPEALAIDR